MGTEVVSWQERLADEAKNVAAMERPSLTSISLRAGVMSINGTQVPGNKLPAVVIASAFENQYYDKPFDPNVKENPLCFSLSLSGEEMVPHPDSKQIQSSTTCAECPMFAWGSDPKGGKGKACKQKRRLALLPAAALKDGEINKAELAVMTLPVMSVKNWSNYVNRLSTEFARPPWAVLTEVSVHPDPRTQFQVKFDTAGLVNDTFLDAIHGRIEQAVGIIMTPYDKTETVEQKPPQKDGKRKF
jgi:hypothetical protein